MNNNYEVKRQLVDVSKLVYERRMVNAFEGNLSVFTGDKIYITPSGVCKGFLTEEMIVATDAQGCILEKSNCMPSSEIKLHLAAYRKRREIKAVIHSHSPYLTAFAIANKAIDTKAYPELIMFFGEIPLAEYGTPSTDEICIAIEKYICDHDVILLANHGVISLGEDLYDAFFKLEAAESIAKTLAITSVIGGEKELPDEKIKEIYMLKEQRGKLKK